jgi:hypothetical protein
MGGRHTEKQTPGVKAAEIFLSQIGKDEGPSSLDSGYKAILASTACRG